MLPSDKTSVGMFSAGYCYVTEEEEEENWEYFSLLSSLTLMRTRKVTPTRSTQLSNPTHSVLNENVRIAGAVILLDYSWSTSAAYAINKIWNIFLGSFRLTTVSTSVSMRHISYIYTWRSLAASFWLHKHILTMMSFL